MTQFFYHWLTKLSPEQVTDTFLIVMLALGTIALILYPFGKFPRFVKETPSLLTALGILGTFIGIILGIYGFDLADIDTSISELMQGLETAFMTSILGLFLSLVLRTIFQIFSKDQPARATADDILQAINDQRQDLTKFQHSISEEVLQSLTSVVEKFNQGLNAQMGDNLQQFTQQLEAVSPALQALIDQHEQHAELAAIYREQTTSLLIEINGAQENLLQLHQRITELPEIFNVIPSLVEQQRTHSEQISVMLNEQQASIEVLQQSIPDIAPKFESITQGIEKANQQLGTQVQHLISLSETQAKVFEQRTNKVVALADVLTSIDPKHFSNIIQETANSHRESMVELAQLIAKTHQQMITELSQVITRDLTNADVSIKRQYELLDQRLHSEVESVMAAMGDALGTLSGEFSRDFRQLIQQMKRIDSQVKQVVGEEHV
ncbi:MotA/TolQ/ExbB proton channel family protein [Microbulbifer sp. MLAF003]|uniref:MotA/TolQ/ExbB proton channel family protein n=1 Tax=Microbulbifer TaxID=48073 RepID=UPI00036E9C32|nr:MULTISPECIES: MotA/TolQ/ExbB proton channel family protein [Microbulbifer]WHI49743.1 MotA/TolQ/ExbB proton channel family protein [Microbulbifer sp. MLAF003]